MNASQRSPGLALVAVLWLLAALSILVGGMLRTLRSEIRTSAQRTTLAGLHTQADAVLTLGAQMMIRAAPFTDPAKVPANLELTWDNQPRSIRVEPLNGLIDINRAPLTLITEMLRTLGGLDFDAALALAQSIEAIRKPTSGPATSQPFLAQEDLMRVPGFTYELYAKIFGHVTAQLPDGTGRVNPHFSSARVLEVLTGGNRARADVLSTSGSATRSLMDTSAMRPDWIDTQLSKCFRLSTALDSAAARWRWHDICLTQDSASGLPWRHIGTGDGGEFTPN